jgi:hypothetical protein
VRSIPIAKIALIFSPRLKALLGLKLACRA